jgi:hypothetical protein
VFGNSGSARNDATNAELVTFAAGLGNIFSFSASGSILNTGGGSLRGPDGLYYPAGLTIAGINGLSSATGNSALPLMGVFLNEANPLGSSAPSALPYDAQSPTSLAPSIGQVFYIGDGRTGFENASGATLSFTAPQNATRLYLGIADGFPPSGPDLYGDNTGTFSVTLTQAVPEPETYAMMLVGLGMMGFMVRRRKQT